MTKELTERGTDVLTGLCAVLILCQTVERMLDFVLQTALPEGEAITLESMERESKENARLVLGKMLGKLRKRADIDDGFESLLRSFLGHRNDLAHNLDRIPGFDLYTDPGLDVAEGFLNDIASEAHQILRIFADLMHQWQIQLDVGPAPPDQVLRFIGSASGLAPHIFFAKPPP